MSLFYPHTWSINSSAGHRVLDGNLFLPSVSWRQLLHCFHASNVALGKSHAILPPDPLWGPCLLSLRKVLESSLLLQFGHFTGASVWGSSPIFFARHSEKLRPSVLGNTFCNIFHWCPPHCFLHLFSLTSYVWKLLTYPSMLISVFSYLPSLGFLVLLPGKVPQLYLLTLLFLISKGSLSCFLLAPLKNASCFMDPTFYFSEDINYSVLKFFFLVLALLLFLWVPFLFFLKLDTFSLFTL